MLAIIKRFLEALFKMIWNTLKKKFGDFLKKWALLGFLVLLFGFVVMVVFIWILVAGF